MTTYFSLDAGPWEVGRELVVQASADHSNDGPHTVAYTAVDQDGNQAPEQTAQVKIDTTPPTFVWRGFSPAAFSTPQPLKLKYEIVDGSASLRVQWQVRDQYGTVVARGSDKRPPGVSRRQVQAKYRNDRPFLAGGYRVQMTVLDEAGNRTVGPTKSFISTCPSATRIWRRLPKAGRRVALTFDDGQVAPWRSILRTLKRNDAHASFFVLGPIARSAPDLMRQTIADGHGVGSHSQTHTSFTKLDAIGISAELRRSAAPWQPHGVALAPYVRPPYGEVNAGALSAAGAAGYPRVILWDVDPRDWAEPGAEEIAQRVVSQVKNGSIVVMHLKAQTAQALPLIIRGLRKRGYEPVSLPELFAAAGQR